MQHQLLDIFYAYFERAPRDPSKCHWLGTIFKNNSFRTNDLLEYIETIDLDTFVEKEWFLYHFNLRLTRQTIFSEMIESLKIGEEIIDCSVIDLHFIE